MKIGWMLAVLVGTSAQAGPVVRLYPGYVTKVTCPGRLLVSAVGAGHSVRLEALPKELGCAVLLKPLEGKGRTNLWLETSAGAFALILEISPQAGRRAPQAPDLRIDLREVQK